MSELHEPTISSDELRPTYIEVDLEQLERNYHAIAAHGALCEVSARQRRWVALHLILLARRDAKRGSGPPVGVESVTRSI